ncbi:MAG: hypothetical protein ACR2GA_06875 [Chloroflexota bacterium]
MSEDLALLDYLKALTFDFERDGQTVSAVLIYAEPDPHEEGRYHPVVAADSGFEGIACLDDTARAVLLALAVYERSQSRTALALARRWLTFVEYMQYPDGSFANFIRNTTGTRNATGLTSMKGGHWWSVRALWALARAYRLTANEHYLERFQACQLPPLLDGKINGIHALALMELYQADPREEFRDAALIHCARIVETTGDAPYLLDQPGQLQVSLWGYHQLNALAEAAGLFERLDFLSLCRRSVNNLIEPDIRARMWHAFPRERKTGVTAYDISTVVQGLGSMYRTSGAERYRTLALRADAWFYGRNDAATPMYDPSVGRCRDGISDRIASMNYGAESAIEAGLAEIERRTLEDE